MILYDIFYKRFGIRLPQHLMTPVIATFDKFDFPRNSIFHALTFDGVLSGPPSDEYIFRNIKKPILMDHVVDLKDNKGVPRKIGQAILPYIREYHVKNRRYRYSSGMLEKVRDETSLMVFNYGFLPKVYRYARSLYTEYHKWWNLERTLWETIAKAATETNRQQFISVDLPRILPSISTLNFFSDSINATFVKLFNTSESLFILELWKWLSKTNRENSVIPIMSQEQLNKINIIFQESGKFVLLNLGVINSWRIDDKREDEIVTKVKIEPEQLQKQFLRLMMTLTHLRALPEDALVEEADKEEPKSIADLEIQESNDDETTREKAVRKLEELDSDLATLVLIEEKASAAEMVEVKPFIKNEGNRTPTAHDFHSDETVEGNILAIADRLADDGLINASSYRGLLKASESYKNIKSPDGKGTLEYFIKIDPNDIIIPESPSIVDIPAVVDKSM
jgi:hypothetical protein